MKVTELDFEELLRRYAGGRIPPLVDTQHPEAGLIDPSIFSIYHQGFLSLYRIDIGLVHANLTAFDQSKKWETADFGLNKELARPNWYSFCRFLRNFDEGDEICLQCDKYWAARAEEEKGTVAYMCDSGLIDFAAPITVAGKTISTIFCGQLKPAEGSIWNPELTWSKGKFRPLRSGESGVDAWEVSRARILSIEKKLKLPPETLLSSLINDMDGPRNEEGTPDKILQITQLINSAAQQISALAEMSFKYQKGNLLNRLDEHINRTLSLINADSTIFIWRGLAESLRFIRIYFGLDYAVILRYISAKKNIIEVLSQSGLPEVEYPLGFEKVIDHSTSEELCNNLFCSNNSYAFLLKDYKDLPIFSWLHQQHARKRSSKAFVIPLKLQSILENNHKYIMLLGKFDRDVVFDHLILEDKQAIENLSLDLAHICEIVALFDQFREEKKKQKIFMTIVAHEIYNPIQTIIMIGSALDAGVVPDEKIAQAGKDIASEVRRLHRISQKAWTLQKIDRDDKMLKQAEGISVYETLSDGRASFLDYAAKRNIRILIDPDLKNWPKVWVNSALFKEAIINLIHNAVKYSYDNTDVRIDGKRMPDGNTLFFINRGIAIRSKDYSRIFNPYERTDEAEAFAHDGSGIGLYLVKAFADRFGSVNVKSQPIPRTLDYVTTFELFIRERSL